MTITSPNSNSGRLYNTSLKEERKVATRVLFCPTVYTMFLLQEMLNKLLKCSLLNQTLTFLSLLLLTTSHSMYFSLQSSSPC